MRLADHITEVSREYEDDSAQTVYVYDEVVFTLPYDRAEETAESIEAEFEGWWIFGENDGEEELTLEERVAILEEVLLGGGL